MTSAATSRLRRLLFISPVGHGDRKEKRYVRLMCVFGSTALGFHSRPWIQHLIGDLDWGLPGYYIKEEAAPPLIRSLLTGTLNEFSRIAGHLERLELKPNISRRDHQ